MQEVRVTRRLTALLLADVVGYSRLMGADEERAHQRLTDYVEGLIEPAVARYRGRLVRSRGDGFLGEFDSAVDAVRCAIDIQQSFAAHPAGDGMEPIRLRIGVNTGDVIVEEQDIYGHSVNIAARLEALAEPGAVYVTGAASAGSKTSIIRSGCSASLMPRPRAKRLPAGRGADCRHACAGSIAGSCRRNRAGKRLSASCWRSPWLQASRCNRCGQAVADPSCRAPRSWSCRSTISAATRRKTMSPTRSPTTLRPIWRGSRAHL